MKLNKKGITLIEIIVSVTLISIVLIFLINLFIKVRNVYNRSQIQTEYKMLASNVIKAIQDDIENFGLANIKYIDKTSKYAVLITFDTSRPTYLSEPIRKILKIYNDKGTYYISYAYDGDYSAYLTSDERSSGVVREMPSDIILNSDTNYIELTKKENIYKIKIPISNELGNIYDINIVGVTKGLQNVEVTNSNYFFEEYNNTYVSNNQSIRNSDAITTIKFTQDYPTGLKINYYVDSEANNDKLTLTYNGRVLKDTINRSINGLSGQNIIGTIEINSVSKGDTLILKYHKDSSTNKFSDTARVTIEELPDVTAINDTYYFINVGKTYASNNQGINSSTAKTVLLFNKNINNLKIKWSVDSEANYDKLNIVYNGSTIVGNKSGIQSNEYTLARVNKNDTLVITYSKNGSINRNTDRAVINLVY